ncbi:hypothetical protein [Moorena sp. SIO3A2]|uniref:hypothetical protein n=1 Tax=Moorena sp. SIO3A2 TaxID=2607841 RepID=UPI0013B8CE5D|nr:hypothetical protein [Moorena sp. SIO3A2]NER85971.1 hypothetical protein [Moorena sp. SIO3A2]
MEFVQNYPQEQREIKISPVIGFGTSNDNVIGLSNIQLWKLNQNRLTPQIHAIRQSRRYAIAFG